MFLPNTVISVPCTLGISNTVLLRLVDLWALLKYIYVKQFNVKANIVTYRSVVLDVIIIAMIITTVIILL